MADEAKVKIDLDFIRMAKRAADGASALTRESDRGCALVGAAMLDATLAAMLRCFFLDDAKVVDGLLDQGRPLATFSSRVDISRAIGILNRDLHSDLTLVRKIRNAAAHFDPDNASGHEFAFADEPVADRCRAIQNCPAELREKLPPRLTFVLFVATASATFAGCASSSRIAKDYDAHGLGRSMLLDLSTVDLCGVIRQGIRDQLATK